MENSTSHRDHSGGVTVCSGSLKGKANTDGTAEKVEEDAGSKATGKATCGGTEELIPEAEPRRRDACRTQTALYRHLLILRGTSGATDRPVIVHERVVPINQQKGVAP